MFGSVRFGVPFGLCNVEDGGSLDSGFDSVCSLSVIHFRRSVNRAAVNNSMHKV